MNGANFTSLVREYTRTNSSTLTDATIVLLANSVKDEFAPKIALADEDLFGTPATRDLVASDASDPTKREYTLPEDLIKMKYVEAKLNGTDWVKLSELDLNTYRRTTNEAKILEIFSNDEGHAFYDIFRKSLWLYTGILTAVVGGLKLWYIAYPADITTGTLTDSVTDLSIDPTTITAGMPRQFHELWARRISILWKSNREKPIPLTEKEQLFHADFTEAITAITNPNLDRDNVGNLPDDSRLQWA